MKRIGSQSEPFGVAAKPRRAQGFTLIELMVVIALVAILVVLAAPSFEAVVLSSKLTSDTSRMVSSVARAKSEAIKRNVVVTMCASSDGATCTGTWKDGWILRADTATPIILTKETKAADGTTINGTPTTLTFQPTGVGATQITFTLCKSPSVVGDKKRQVTISLTGNTTVQSVTSGTCS